MYKNSAKTAPSKPDIRYKQSALQSLGEHLSIMERNSTEAEREFAKTKLLEFYERELNKPEKQSFDAIITDIKDHGLFIEIKDTLTFGMVHISTLDNDFYILNKDSTAITGRRTKTKYTLGQSIQVQIERVDRFKRQIDFRVSGIVDSLNQKADFRRSVNRFVCVGKNG